MQNAAPPNGPSELTERQRRHLKGLAHALKPIVRLGNAGLTEAVALETERALHDHELIKVRPRAATVRRAMRSSRPSPRGPAAPWFSASATSRCCIGRERTWRAS
jgi:hypothetical protein